MTEFAPQGSGQWLNQRVGRLTASRMAVAMSFLKNGKPTAERDALMRELLAERLTGDAVPHFVNDAMRHGTEYEPIAKREYQIQTGELLTECGFIEHPEIEFFGASPDSLLDHDAVVEFKCPATTTHIRWLQEGGVPEQHKPQILAQIACTRRCRAVFVSFDPRIPGAKHRLIVREWEPKQEEIEAVEEAARRFLAELDAAFMQLVEAV